MITNLYSKRRWLMVLVVVVVVAGLAGLALIYSPGQLMADLTSYSDSEAFCTGHELTEAEVASFRGISVEDVHLLVTQDGRQLKDICLMAGKDLGKRIVKVQPK